MSDAAKDDRPLLIGTGAMGTDLLDQWGLMLFTALGETPYQVGSSIRGKQWRDVDVRIIMDDEKFEMLFGKYRAGRTHAFWQAFMLSFSLWGQKVTGLPIDFQIQRRSDVTEADWEKPRNPLGIYPSNVPVPPWRD